MGRIAADARRAKQRRRIGARHGRAEATQAVNEVSCRHKGTTGANVTPALQAVWSRRKFLPSTAAQRFTTAQNFNA